MGGWPSFLGTRVPSALRRLREPAWPLLAVFFSLVVAGVLTIAGNAQAATTYKLTLEPQGAPGAVSLSSTTCTAALKKLAAETSTTPYALGVAPNLFPALSVTTVSIASDTTPCTTLVLQGSSTVFSKSVTILVVGNWTSTTAKSPTFSVAVSFGSVSLGSLLAPGSGTNIGATLSNAWLAATTASGGSKLAVNPSATTPALAAVAQFFTGFKGTTVDVTTSGLSFAADLGSGGALSTGLSKLGVTGVQLTGKLVASLGNFSVSKAPSASLGFTVTATFGLNLPDLPDWLSFPQTAFSLSVSGTSSGTWSVAVKGLATVILPPDTAKTQFTATFSVSQAGAKTPVTVGLSIQMGKLSDAFGLSWLTLTTTTLKWTVSSGTLSASLHAGLTLGTTPTAVKLTATVTLSSSTGATASLSLATTGTTLSTDNLASDLSLALPAHAPNVTLKQLVVYLKVPKKGSVTVAVEAGATLTIASNSYAVSFLVRYDGTSLVVAAKTTSPFQLKQLDSSLPTMANFTLEHLAILFSTKSVTLKSTAIDPATKAYFEPLYCAPGTTCAFTAKVKSGVTIQASVGLSPTVAKMVCKLLNPNATPTPTTCVKGPVSIDGHIPLFGTAATVGISVTLPTVRLDAGPVQQVTLSLAVAATKTGVSVTVAGDMVLLAPSAHAPATGSCPTGITPPATHVCLTLTVSGTLTAGTQGVSITFTAVVKGQWRLPNPVTWLTIHRLAAQIGVTVGVKGGAGLTLGIAGTFTLGTTLGFAVHLKVTPEAPWVELLGFKVKSTTGISMKDLATLYHDVTGDTLTPNLLPPLALKDLLFEYSATNDKTLGLCQGLHISADLVVTNGHWTQGSSGAPTSVTCGTAHPTRGPTRTPACTDNKASCLASVLITLSSNGFIGKGYLTGWSAGPLHFTATTLGITLTNTEIQVHISGGGRLLTPFTWLTTGTSAPTWLEGSITLTVGTQRLHLAATGQIGTLKATISGTGSFSDLTNPGFTLKSWFTTAITSVKNAFVTADNHIKSAMTTVATTTKGWYTTYVAPGAEQIVGDIQGAYKFFGSTGPPTWVKVYTVFQKITSAISGWNSAVNSITLSSLDITSSAIFHDALHGIHVDGWAPCVFTVCVTIVPGFTIPGVCSYVTALKTTPLCTSSTLVTAAQGFYANPTVTEHLGGATLTLPPGSSEQSLVTHIHAIDPTTGSTPPITCAMATESYDSKFESQMSLEVNTLGNTVSTLGPDPTSFSNLSTTSNTVSNDKVIGQNTLDTLTSGVNQGACSSPSVTFLSVGLDHPWIYEGTTVTATAMVGSGVTGVTITWGDGSTPTAATYTGTNKDYVASHVYADETGGNATKSPFFVTASATVAQGVTPVKPAVTRISVIDAPLQLSPLTVTPSPVTVMHAVTVSGNLTNPEAGEPATVTVTWGDGTETTTVPVASTGTFSASHVYQALTPPGAPVRNEPISATVTEPDSTSAVVASSVTVRDVAPSDLTLSPTSGAIVSNHGTVFTKTGTTVGWSSQVLDVSPQQRFTFTFDWEDTTPVNHADVTKPTPKTANAQNLYAYPVPGGKITHTFSDACLYTVKTTATDDDTLSATLMTSVIVTATPGSVPKSSRYWLTQVLHDTRSGYLSPATVQCYLKIAQHLSPQLGLQLTTTSAAGILQPRLTTLIGTEKLTAELKQALLTVLLNFANGSWSWTQVVTQKGATLQELVLNADQALASGTSTTINAALDALVRTIPRT